MLRIVALLVLDFMKSRRRIIGGEREGRGRRRGCRLSSCIMGFPLKISVLFFSQSFNDGGLVEKELNAPLV